tara:strand:+ start:2014 stop:2292 length:279 start_codon:yes stop_codon:yes gene_type:complete
MKAIILMIFIIGIVCITIGYKNNYSKCPPPTIEYRYIPRTFYEEQITNVDLKNLYSNIFNEKSTWSTYPFNESNSKYNENNYDNFIETSSNE